ncbi:uncharacterized protein LOC143219293 [Lasioglossum baleicum]|uniref:uncharacterized protein LOC143219293 n=1 Tax=Lasioglossum baleicum TaxID=434251 RepID=UPI003FCDEDF4
MKSAYTSNPREFTESVRWKVWFGFSWRSRRTERRGGRCAGKKERITGRMSQKRCRGAWNAVSGSPDRGIFFWPVSLYSWALVLFKTARWRKKKRKNGQTPFSCTPSTFRFASFMPDVLASLNLLQEL